MTKTTYTLLYATLAATVAIMAVSTVVMNSRLVSASTRASRAWQAQTQLQQRLVIAETTLANQVSLTSLASDSLADAGFQPVTQPLVVTISDLVASR